MPPTLSNPQVRFAVHPHAPAATRIFDAPVLLRCWHLTSLDAPTVAVVWSLAFAWAAPVVLPPWIPILLALAAWAVYVADRLLDARTAFRTANFASMRERHRFHHRHRRFLAPLALAAAAACASIVFFLMPAPARERNSVLGVAALAYFTGVHSSRRLAAFGLSNRLPILRKELLVGLLFTAACVLPALSRTAGAKLLALPAAAVFFAMLAWLNCHAIDRWEKLEPVQRTSISSNAGLLAIAGVVLAAIVAPVQPRAAALLLTAAGSSLLLALLDRVRAHLTPLALRALADLVLLTPLALLLR